MLVLFPTPALKAGMFMSASSPSSTLTVDVTTSLVMRFGKSPQFCCSPATSCPPDWVSAVNGLISHFYVFFISCNFRGTFPDIAPHLLILCTLTELRPGLQRCPRASPHPRAALEAHGPRGSLQSVWNPSAPPHPGLIPAVFSSVRQMGAITGVFLLFAHSLCCSC